MKRWLCLFCLALGVVFLGIPQRCVRPYLHPHAVGDRSVLRQNEFVFTWRRALPAANPDRADPSEFFATEFGFLIRDITDDDGPPGWTIEGRRVLMRVLKVGLQVARLPVTLAA